MKKIVFCVGVLLSLIQNPLRADEGMWLFDAVPEQQIKEKYDFRFSDYWLSDLQQSTCRFAKRGSASFVSSKGLIMTNHHVGAKNLDELSTPERNLLENGFYAKTYEEELRCPGLEVLVPVKIIDVTGEIEKIVRDKKGKPLPADEAAKARNAFIAELEKRTSEKWDLRCEVTTLFQGGAYHLYGYKVYNDVRLVFAPEQSIAAFGGDPDNYEYPRFCLDCTFFRAYENEKPAEIGHWLGWSTEGPKEEDLVFVSGFPGKTDRAYTREHLEFQRDVFFPWRLQKLFRREVLYSAFAERDEENARRIRNDLDAVKNYRKRAVGQLQGLQTPSLWDGKLSAEGKNENSPEGKIAAACCAMSTRESNLPVYCIYDLLEGAEAFNSKTFQIARSLVRLVYETAKPNGERLREYRDSGLDSLKQSLFAETPIYEDVEVLKLTDSLTMLRESGQGKLWDDLFELGNLGNDKSPGEMALDLIRGSKVRDVAERKRLFEGGLKAIEGSDDPMIKFVLRIDSVSRDCREHYETDFEAPMEQAYAELAKKRFAELGRSVYPDATFTLRLSYGAVKGYEEDNGEKVMPITNIAGMFQRAEKHHFKEPFNPPKSWIDAKSKLDLNTPFNLVSTNDIIGGNSGSPLVNAKGEVVGLVFDGNIDSLSNNFVYSDKQSRCVSVHAAVIVEALRKVYGADKLADELGK